MWGFTVKTSFHSMELKHRDNCKSKLWGFNVKTRLPRMKLKHRNKVESKLCGTLFYSMGVDHKDNFKLCGTLLSRQAFLTSSLRIAITLNDIRLYCQGTPSYHEA
jgi:hypothetical protein